MVVNKISVDEFLHISFYTVLMEVCAQSFLVISPTFVLRQLLVRGEVGGFSSSNGLIHTKNFHQFQFSFLEKSVRDLIFQQL